MTGVPADPEYDVYWLRPQRSRNTTQTWFQSNVLAGVVRGAAAAGMRLREVGVDDVEVTYVAGRPAVLVDGSSVDPSRAFFHTKILTWPDAAPDVWRQVSLITTLQLAGVHVTVPATMSLVCNDKLATVLTHAPPGMPCVDTLRISTRQFGWLSRPELEIEFPLLVKPNDWGGGNAVVLVHDRHELQAVLQLAGAGEVTMLAQRWLGEDVEDCRVYCFDGTPSRALRRRPAAGTIVSNVNQGGTAVLDDVPPELVGSAAYVARSVGLPYVCVDFLKSDDTWFFSEVELDGSTGISDELTSRRFASYRHGFTRFLSQKTESPLEAVERSTPQ